MIKRKILSIVLVAILILPIATSCNGLSKEVINPKLAGEVEATYAGTMGQKIKYDPDKEYGGYLGYGYDIANSAYFNSGDISPSASILDMNALVKKGLVFSVEKARPASTIYIGESLKTYQESVSSKIGISFSYGLFSKIKGDFSLTTDSASSSSSKNVYIKNLVKIEKERQYINTAEITYNDLKKYANKNFLKALNTDTSKLTDEKKQEYYDKLFKTYGTHILVDIILGGRMDLNYVYNNTESKSSQQITSEVNAAYSAMKIKVSGSVDVETETKATNFVSKTTFQCTRTGGTVTGEIMSYQEAKEAYKDWAESIQNSVTLELIDIGNNCDGSLIGIWELADEGKQDNIYLAYLKYLEAAGNLFSEIDSKSGKTQVPLYIKNIYIGSASSSALAISDIESQISHSEPDALYKIISTDLNKGVHGDYIYVGYTFTTNPSEAVTDLKVEWWSKESNAKNTYDYKNITYNCIKKDLNKNAGGKYVYLYYTKNTSAGKPLTDIGVEIDGKYSFGSSAAGWVSVLGLTSSDKADCNKGCGDPYIYLWFKR